jgi:opacity protein-like surface antigen
VNGHRFSVIFLAPFPGRDGRRPPRSRRSRNLRDDGYADPRSDNAYRSSQALLFAFEWQKTATAAWRGSAGFLFAEGREAIDPAAGTRDADALYIAGNLVLTARFPVFQPYFTAGLGVYSFRVTDNIDSRQQVELGANWGVGLDIQLLSHFAIRGEYDFHYTTGGVSSPIEVVAVGGRFTF